MTPHLVVAVTTLVIALATALLAATGTPWQHAIALAGVPGAASLSVGLLGAVALDRLRRGSLAQQVTLVAVVSVAAVAIGTAVAAMSMYLESDGVLALVVVVGVAGSAGVVLATALAHRVAEQVVGLQMSVRQLGQSQERSPGAEPDVRELRSVAVDLQASAMKVAAERARGQLLAWVSHDLRSPLAGVRVLAEALHDGVADDAVTRRHYTDRLRAETERLTKLVEDLFELSRIESRQLHLDFEEGSLADVVSDALASAEIIAATQGVRLEGNLADDPGLVHIATREVSRVVTNLVDNAVRATPSGGTVRVELGMSDDDAVVSVTDECGGTSDDLLAPWTDDAAPGGRRPGLGLAIAKGFVEAHGGVLTAGNEGRGCRFEVRLPIKAVLASR